MTESTTEWLNRIQTAQRDLFDCGHQLKSLANILARVGLHELADEIREIGVAILHAESEVGGGVGQMLHEAIAEGNQQLGETMLALLKAVNERKEVSHE